MMAERKHRRSHWLERGWGRRLALLVALKVGVVLWVGIGDADRAILGCVRGDCFVPSPYDLPDVMVMFFCLLPPSAFSLTWSDMVGRGLAREGATVLPRVSSRVSWAWGRVRSLALAALSFSLVGNLAALLALAVANRGVVSVHALGTALAAAPLEALLLLALSLAVNAAALVVDPVVACVAAVGTHAGTLVALRMSSASLALAAARWLPSAWGTLAWCRECGLPYPAALALLALLALVSVRALVGAVERCDIL